MSAALEIGECVGPYRIIEPLGGGGMGMVYRAVHALLHRPAAIKVLHPELGAHEIAAGRFLTEARATTAIRHPGIVQVYDYGHTASGRAYIAMELLEGMTLAERLGRGPLSLVEAMTIARRIAAPLAAAHEGGIIHRDLKPENVFLVRDREGSGIEQVKLLDFGIAKLESAATPHHTTIGVVLGTPSYMSPEQCLGTRECDARTDLYALGCILFEMLCGRPPYSDVPTGDLLAAHVQRPVPDISRLVSIPSEIAHLVTRLLAKSPDDRPRNAVDVVSAIDRWLAPRGHVPPRRGLRAAIAAAIGIAISLSSIGAWYRWWRGRRAVAVETSTQDITHEYAPVYRLVAVGTDAGADTEEVTTPLDAVAAPDAAPRLARGSTPAVNQRRPPPPAAVGVQTPVAVDVVEDIGSAAAIDVHTPVEDP